MDHHSEDRFSHVEYREAANAYFKGVEIGYSTLRNYVTINALFAAVIGALMDPKFSSDPTQVSAVEIVSVMPWIAITASLLLALALPHYFKHLENCRLRCEQLESIQSPRGELFTNLGAIASGSRSFNALHGLVGIILLMSALWLYVGLRLNFGSANIFEVGRRLLSP